VSKFAALLGTKGNLKDSVASSLVNSDPLATASRELMLCLSKEVQGHEVICTLPSLDMRSVDEEACLDPLPKVGEHRSIGSSLVPPDGGMSLPQMEASVLNNAADASVKAAQVEQKAAQSLAFLTSWTKSSILYAASAIAKNVSDSFSSLVYSRVRAWTLLLLRHSLTTGDSASRSRLLSMLSSIVKVDSARTTFKTLPLPESAVGQPKEADVILPLLLEVDMEVSIQSKQHTITLRAPGTISGNFEKGMDGLGMGLVKVDVLLDTGVMLESMVQQARMIVFKAVAKATSATDASQPDSNGESRQVDPRQPLATTLAGFSSALNISSGASEGSHQPVHRLHKARSSALKLNNVLEGDGGQQNGSALAKTRKSRSVQWDHHVDLPKVKSVALPSSKRQRVAHTTARLTSFKSFGRPHAGDFGSGPRNATFGDFGRKPIWGRDGKLANHPTPMQPSDVQTQDFLTSTSRNSKNATFDIQRPNIHLSSEFDLGNGSKPRANMRRVPSSIPRTATALEGWLVERTGGKF